MPDKPVNSGSNPFADVMSPLKSDSNITKNSGSNPFATSIPTRLRIIFYLYYDASNILTLVLIS